MAGSSPTDAGDSPLSLKRLTAAFAQMLGAPQQAAEDQTPSPAPDPCEISPQSIVEAVLFVGAGEDRPHTAERLAAAMRDISPSEVVEAIRELNEAYQQSDAPYRIVERGGGYRMELRTELNRMRDKFHGRVKEAKLSAAAMEVLSIVAYKQPLPAGRVDQIRGARSASLLASLVRRGLVRLDRPDEGPPSYQTTPRFLRLFGLTSVDQLPRAAEMED
ncbi:MAG: SMC-Scp complex subunit ScpB [Planctomycetota bacterium]